MKKIYVIFKFEENKFEFPEVFTSEEEFNSRMEELTEVLRDNADGAVDEWDEIGGREVSQRCTDTIYRAFSEDIPEGCTQLHLYADMEDDEHFHIGNVEVTADFGEGLKHYNGKVEELKERYARDEEEGCGLCIAEKRGISMREIYTESSNGKCGYCMFGAMLGDVEDWSAVEG